MVDQKGAMKKIELKKILRFPHSPEKKRALIEAFSV